MESKLIQVCVCVYVNVCVQVCVQYPYIHILSYNLVADLDAVVQRAFDVGIDKVVTSICVPYIQYFIHSQSYTM